MSLFKAREWWSCQVGSGEQFDYGCLKVGSFNEESNNKIVVGSHSGILRIYSPSSSEPDSITSNHATDLLLEKNLGMPIVQIEIGKFISTSTVNQIAVLFSHKLSVYDYNEQSGMTEQGRQIDLELNYEHNLNRPTFNMCKGHFGSGGRGNKDSSNHEYICVQTLDGVLFVFEYERQSMVKSLPNTYLPGPLCYLSRSDAFLTVSSNYHLECYKYQALAISSGVDHGTNNNDVRRKGVEDESSLSTSQSSKRVLPEWSFNLGECALGIQTTQRIKNTPQTIIVLGERNLFCLSDNGQLIFMSKFEYNPSSFIIYNNENNNNGMQSDSSSSGVRYIISTHSHTLFIVQDGHIRWAAHVDSIPVQVEVCTVQGIRGMICTLSETGSLQCCYLGTEPVSTSIPAITSGTMINIQDAEQQLSKLNKEIKQAMNDPTLVIKRKANAQVVIQIENTNQFSMTDDTRFQRGDSESNVPVLNLNIRVKSNEAIQNVLLTVNINSPLCAQPNEVRMGHIGGTTSVGTATIAFWMRDDLTPWNLEATFTVSYNTVSDNVCHTVQKTYKLPLKLVARSFQQSSTGGQCKLTLGANKPVVDLNTVFPELSTAESNSQQGLTIRFYGSNENISILASSKSQKYRFQADSLASIWLFSNLLTERLHASSSTIEFEFGDPLPLEDYFLLVDRHYETRVECEQINSTLDICSKQFRAIQKRLLNKFKDKTPTLLDNLDILLENTNQQIVALANRYEQCRYELSRSSHDLSCATKLICLLLKISVNLSNENAQLLNAILSPVISDDNEQGWEETVDAAVNYALRTVLSRSKTIDMGTTSNTIGNSTINIDINKLKKRIQTLCERLEKGGSLVSSNSATDRSHSPESSYPSTKKAKPPISNHYDHDKIDDNDDDDMPKDDYESPFRLLPSSNSRKNYNNDDDEDQ
ncbi:unnamed protein product [Adineta steineri]|uniref:PTHB1-like protein n=1 Tax=Adineta steineri TaxID=433720 RepID=A0A814S478_9BILA|nr:unnamed protein product [Adineta steineri]CAF3541202.1 unnamed protein product [Adineta steineri]